MAPGDHTRVEDESSRNLRGLEGKCKYFSIIYRHKKQTDSEFSRVSFGEGVKFGRLVVNISLAQGAYNPKNVFPLVKSLYESRKMKMRFLRLVTRIPYEFLK